MARGAKLVLQWSPEQISGWLKREFSTDQDMQISHEAIYRSLFVQTRGWCPSPRATRRGRRSRRAGPLGRRSSNRGE